MPLQTYLVLLLSIISITIGILRWKYNVHIFHKQCCFSAQNEFLPKMELANQGWIQGKLLKTVGNLDNEPRTIYTYRNIPYADHSEFLRFHSYIFAMATVDSKKVSRELGNIKVLDCFKQALAVALI